MPYYLDKKREYERRKLARTRGVARAVASQAKMYEALSALIKWSADGEYSHGSDMLPALTYGEVSHRFSNLQRKGYAESVIYKECSSSDKWWRVTDAGRHAHELHVFTTELKREFGLLDGGKAVPSGPAVGSPDRSGSRAVRETLEVVV